MKFSGILSLVALVSSAAAASVAYDEGYDDASRSMGVVSCSDGENGLMDQYPTQGNLPHFPYVGAIPAIAGWNSPNCGTCWALTYKGKTIHILGIDHGNAYNIALEAMDDLTGGKAKQLGRIEADAVQVDASNCGL